MFRKVIFLQIYNLFQEKRLLYCTEYGFHTEHSTEFAALELVDKIIFNMDKIKTPIGIFLDLSKAFDTHDHEILLYKLKQYGFNCNALNLIKSYLTDDKQFVQIDDTQSHSSNIITGVPQGSTLGPLLFIIYINDICQASKLFDFIIYADDTSLSTTLEIILKKDNSTSMQNTINNELVNINDWLKLNKLSLNIQKTKYMICQTPQKEVPTNIINFHGITIKKHLHWKYHVDNFCNNISRNIEILNKRKHFQPLNLINCI